MPVVLVVLVAGRVEPVRASVDCVHAVACFGDVADLLVLGGVAVVAAAAEASVTAWEYSALSFERVEPD